MAVLGAILGILVGFTIGIFFTEVVFSNNSSWPDVIPFALAILGGLAGNQLGKQLSTWRANRTRSA